ncbi:MAG: ribosome maturation factor RimM, partial [Deltaproteobacteria bacterium]|nr:ribosome maturation factor RimM [Deltaproteobacteria bacterium]
MPDSSFLLIGNIRKAHGIKGEVGVEYYADSPDLLQEGVFLRRGQDTPVFHEIASMRVHHGALLLRLAAIPDRTAAEALRGYDVLVPASRLPEDDSIYRYQLMGVAVLAVDEQGAETAWGTISDIADAAGQELWTISRDGEEDILFPATPGFVLG